MLRIHGICLLFVVGKCFAQAEEGIAKTFKEPHFTKETFFPDITTLKYVDSDDHIQLLNVLASHFPFLYLSSGISELSNDLSALLSSIGGKSKLILTVSVSTPREVDILLDNIELIIKKYDLGHRCEAILFAVSQHAFNVFNYTHVQSKIQALEIATKTGISRQDWMSSALVSASLPKKIDVLELLAGSVDSFVTYSLFEDYVDSLLEPYNFLTGKGKENPVFILRSELQLREDWFQDNQTITRYLCLQAEMMAQISHSRNIHFVLGIADKIKIANGITFFANRTSPQSFCFLPKDLETTVIYSAPAVSSYRWAMNPPSLREMLVISELFTATYNSASITLGTIPSYYKFTIFKKYQTNPNISLGIYAPIKGQRDSYLLDSFLMELAKHPPVSISTIHINLAGLIFYLQSQHSKERLGNDSNAESISKVAAEFKEKFTKINVTLVTLCERLDVVNAVVDYPIIMENSSTEAAYIKEVLLISDMVLWHESIPQKTGIENFNIYQSIKMRLTYTTALYHKFKSIYADVELIFGVRFYYLHSSEAESCRPKMWMRNDQFLHIMYNWAGIYGLKIAETVPFTWFTDSNIQYGRWTVVPHTQLWVNGSLQNTSEAPCETWDPNEIEKSTYKRINSTGVSINYSSLRELDKTSRRQILQIAVARFQAIELVFSAETNTTVETRCPANGNRLSVLREVLPLPETNESTNIFVSLEQDDNLYLALNCLNKQIKPKNTSGILSGIHISVSTITTLGENMELFNLLKGSIVEYKTAKIAFGLLLPNCTFNVKLDIPPEYAIFLNYVEYLICDLPAEPSSNYPFNFARLRYHLDIARSLQLRIDSDKATWASNPKVKIRIGWPKLAHIAPDEINKHFLKFFRDVDALSKVFQIPYFIKEAFQTDKSNYVGWWYGGTNNISSITERESEFLESQTWRPEVPKVLQNLPQTTNIWIWVSIALFLVVVLTLSTLGLFLYRMHRKNIILSKEDVQEFFEEDCDTSQDDVQNDEGLARIKKYNKKNELPWKEIKFDRTNQIGSGQFGLIYSTIFRNEKVAVKVAKERTRNCVKSIMSEILIMGMLEEHINILKFVGAYTQEIKRGIICLVTEFCETGSLHSHLQSLCTNTFQENINSTTQFSLVSIHELCRFCQQIARGMDFLGKQNIVHGDLSARNILLDWQLTCKISDFGLSRKVKEYESKKESNDEFIPWRWMAVEALVRLEFTVKSDVWSFGVTAWEVFSLGSLPYAGLIWSEDFASDLANGLKLPKPTYASAAIYQILKDCWEIEPVDRPEFSLLEEFFKKNCPTDYACV